MFRWLISVVVFLTGLALAPSALAACVYVGGNTVECSGNSNGSAVIGTVGPETFIFADGVTGSIIIQSGGGADTIDFSQFTTPVTVDVSAAGPQTVAPGLSIWWQGFDAPGVAYTIRGGSSADTLTGAGGDDTLVGGPGADALNGGAGTDTRGDLTTADCAGDVLNSIEADLCPPPAVPTTSEWTLILLGLVLAGAAMMAVASRRFV